MALTKQKKVEILANVTDALTKTASVAFVGFKSVTVAEANELRRTLKAEGVRYVVVKKTLLKKALTDHGISGDMPELPGEVAFAYLSAEASAKADRDLTLPERSLQAFVKKLKGKLSFLGGVLEGKYLSQNETLTIAAIPATPILRGMFVNIINSPIQRFAIAMSEVAKKK